LGDAVYKPLKYTAQIALPAIGTLYFAIASIWGLPNAEEVVGTITAFDAFLGVLLGLSTQAYKNSEPHYDGAIVVEENEGKKVFSLELNSPPEDLEKKDTATFKVNS
jgi:hypothetical protein